MEIGTLAFKYWIEFLFGVIAAILTGGFAVIWKRFRSFNNGMVALLRDRIIQAYNHCIDKGYCPIYALENVHDMFRQYENLGGNGTVKRLVEELEALPRSRGKEEKNI